MLLLNLLRKRFLGAGKNHPLSAMKDCRKSAVGGTFSLLHRGHRYLLSHAALHSEKILIGVTSDEYARSRKTHPVEPFEQRALSVLLYIFTVNPRIAVEVIPIDDAYGPAVSDPELDCIFVSEETLPGAFAINIVRRLRGLTPLKIYSVDTVLDEKGVRLSSTLLWQRAAATHLDPQSFGNYRHKNDPDR